MNDVIYTFIGLAAWFLAAVVFMLAADAVRQFWRWWRG